MKKEKVRCWKTGKHQELLITYPENDMGHQLISCANCGQIYAVNVTKQLYIEPDLERQLRGIKCLACGVGLDKYWFYYPETYLDENGQIKKYVRDSEMPDMDDSMVLEIYEVFS